MNDILVVTSQHPAKGEPRPNSILSYARWTFNIEPEKDTFQVFQRGPQFSGSSRLFSGNPFFVRAKDPKFETLRLLEIFLNPDLSFGVVIFC